MSEVSIWSTAPSTASIHPGSPEILVSPALSTWRLGAEMDKIGEPIRGVDTNTDLTRANLTIGIPIGERREKSGSSSREAVMRLAAGRGKYVHADLGTLRICEVRGSY
jgi:hypothetical protein